MKCAFLHMLIVLGLCGITLADNRLQLRQFDVGEGSALLLTQGEDALLIDVGNPMAAGKLVRQVAALGHRTLRVLITHPHQDHIGGVFQILDELDVKKIYDNGQPLDGQEEPYRWYSEVVRASERPYEQLRAGDTLRLGKARILVLSPPSGPLDSDWNKNSLVLKVIFGKFCALLMADALVSTERNLLGSKSIDLECPLVQVGHHGSKFASSPDFVNATKAKTAMVSVNASNIRGYPAEESLNAWKRSGASVLRTDQGGSILCNAEESGKYEISTER